MRSESRQHNKVYLNMQQAKGESRHHNKYSYTSTRKVNQYITKSIHRLAIGK